MTWLGRGEPSLPHARSLGAGHPRSTLHSAGYLRLRLALFGVVLSGVLIFAFLPLSPVTAPVMGAMLLAPALLLRRDERAQRLLTADLGPAQIPTTLS